MPVFISYSHQDKDFVERFAAELVRHKIHVWIDTWELNVGDSLINRIQEAIETASALIVVLSKASVASEWCRKELSSGLIRELEEKRVVVLPVVIDDCEIPLFLRDKFYADFRTDPDDGIRKTLEAVASVTSSAQGRIESPDLHEDWSVDIGEDEGVVRMSITVVSHGTAYPYCILTQFHFICNEVASAHYLPLIKNGLHAMVEGFLVEFFYEEVKDSKDDQFAFILDDAKPHSREIGFDDAKSDKFTHCTVSSRWLGTDTGKSIRINYGGQIINVRNSLREVIRELSLEEQKKFAAWMMKSSEAKVKDGKKPVREKKYKQRKRK